MLRPFGKFPAEIRARLSDQSGRQRTMVARAAELIQLDASHALEFRIAKQGETQAALSRDLARASHRLNVMASIFLPLACIASVFGMDLEHGLDHNSVPLFWTVLIGGVLLGVAISGFLLGAGGDGKK